MKATRPKYVFSKLVSPFYQVHWLKIDHNSSLYIFINKRKKKEKFCLYKWFYLPSKNAMLMTENELIRIIRIEKLIWLGSRLKFSKEWCTLTSERKRRRLKFTLYKIFHQFCVLINMTIQNSHLNRIDNFILNKTIFFYYF